MSSAVDSAGVLAAEVEADGFALGPRKAVGSRRTVLMATRTAARARERKRTLGFLNAASPEGFVV